MVKFKVGDYLKPHSGTKQTNYHDVTNLSKVLVTEVRDSTGGMANLRVMEGSTYDRQYGYTRHASGGNREFVVYDPKKWVLYDEVTEDYDIW